MSELEDLKAHIRNSARGVVEFESDNPLILVGLMRLKALGQNPWERDRAEAYARALRDLGHDPDEFYPRGRVVIGERVPAIRDNRDEWEKGPER